MVRFKQMTLLTPLRWGSVAQVPTSPGMISLQGRYTGQDDWRSKSSGVWVINLNPVYTQLNEWGEMDLKPLWGDLELVKIFIMFMVVIWSPISNLGV